MIGYTDKITLVCLECGNSFKAKIQANAKFCSITCGKDYRKKTGISKQRRQIKMNCVVCEKTYYTNKANSKKRKYCSKKCADVGRVPTIKNQKRNIVKNVCNNCGEEFYCESYKLAKFCNRVCWNEYQTKKWVELICRTCKKKFKIRASYFKYQKQTVKYCSRECFMKKGSSARMITKKCKSCGKNFTLPYYKFKDYKLNNGTIKRGRAYCSTKCGYNRK